MLFLIDAFMSTTHKQDAKGPDSRNPAKRDLRSTRHKTYNNLIFGNSGTAVAVAYQPGSNDNRIYNNTIYGNTGHGIVVGASAPDNHNLIKNNLVVSNGGDGIRNSSREEGGPEPAGTIIQNNLLYKNRGSNMIVSTGTNAVISGNLNADPRFADAAAGNFHLRPGSPSWELARRNIGATRRYAERFVDSGRTRARGELSSTAFCLADSGFDYLVFLPQGGQATVDLSAISGSVAMDHAGRWETSLLMYLCPELVVMSRIPPEGALTEDGQSTASGAEEDARRYSSPELGKNIATAIVDSIGCKAQELLASLG
jgi:hypothetical protein